MPRAKCPDTRYMSIRHHQAIDPELLMAFEPIDLDRMDSIRLMNRIDTKYVTTSSVLDSILRKSLACGYMMFVSEGVRIHPYDSIYFDTSDLRMFLDHRNSRLVRQKVRTRIYSASELCFLEVKSKNNHSRTKKKRISIPPEEFTDFRGDNKCSDFLAKITGYRADSLSPSVETSFSRMTLVDKDLSERITIDSDICFRNMRNGVTSGLGDVVIIELKRDGRKRSTMQDILLSLRVKPMRISKYCMGVALTDSQCRPGRFLEKIRACEKLCSSQRPRNLVGG